MKNKKNDEKSIDDSKDYKLKFQRIILFIVIGLCLRFFLFAAFPDSYFYKSDHLTFWGWYKGFLREGILNCYGYDRPEFSIDYYGSPCNIMVHERCIGPDGKTYNPEDVITLPGNPVKVGAINYPPLSAYIFYLQGLLHKMADPQLEPLTFIALLIPVCFSCVAEFFLALALMLIVRHFKGDRWAFYAFLIIWFSPGLFLTGIIWLQRDSFFLALSLWSIYYCLKEKWILAGSFFGLALMIKPQPILMIPPLIYFFFISPMYKSFLLYISSMLLTVIITSAPFMFYSGFAWISNTYLFNLKDLLPHSTLYAFNLWMVDLIRCRNTDVYVTILGLTKKFWGTLFLGLTLAMSFLAVYLRYGKNKISLPLLIALTYSVSFLFPTRVHDRYIVYILPFLLIYNCVEQHGWPVFAVFSIAALLETTHYIWLKVSFDLSYASGSNLFILFLLSSLNIVSFFYWIMILLKKRLITEIQKK